MDQYKKNIKQMKLDGATDARSEPEPERGSLWSLLKHKKIPYMLNTASNLAVNNFLP